MTGDIGATNGCFYADSECLDLPNGGNFCDLVLYFGFTGTDANGVYLFSSESRASQFKGYSWFGFPDFSPWNLNTED